MTAADLIIEGRIATLAGDRGFGWAEALAIADGRVLGSGPRHEIEALAGPATRRWHIPPHQVVLPAITDAHIHLLSGAQEALEVQLDDVPDRESVLRSIAEAHARMAASGDDGWMLGHGWSLDRMGGWPTAADLEAVAPGRPVSLAAHDHHSRWVSGPALAAAGIGRDTPDPEGGLIRRDEHGDATGLLHEHASKLVLGAIPRLSAERLEVALAAYARSLAELGVIGAQDPGEMGDDPELRWGPTFYRAVARAGRLPLRVASSIRPEQLDVAIERGFTSGEQVASDEPGDAAAVRRSARYRGGWLKLFADGAMGSRSAALLAPYEPEDEDHRPVGGPSGMLLHPRAVLAAYAQRAAAAGIAVQIHGIGDQAVRTALDVLGGLPRPGRGFRHRVEHAQLVHPDDWARFGSLDIVASMQPCHMISDAVVARSAWGRRTAWTFPVRSIDAGGALIAFGTDAPVEPADPWTGIAVAVSRIAAPWAADGPFHPEQAVDLARAIRGACLDPALSAGEMDRGRLVAGHLADLIVIGATGIDEPGTVGGPLATTRPLATLLDGGFVWRDASFDP